MPEIDEMYDRIYSLVEHIDATEFMHGSEGRRGVTVGKNIDFPQVIEVEFNGSVPENAKIDLLQAVNGTGWEFVDEDDVFNGDNSGGGLITVSRDIDPEDASVFDEFNREDYF